MAVKRIVPNIAAASTEAARAFYSGILGMEVAMDMGWIITFASNAHTVPQVSVATEGGSGTAVPDLSIEVDDVDDAHRRVLSAGLQVEYGPVNEPWGVRRFYVRDPMKRLINILSHYPVEADRGRQSARDGSRPGRTSLRKG
jgi:catechol 2,3-dioxygenase-like lactoylglutathione lyase family enzyme